MAKRLLSIEKLAAMCSASLAYFFAESDSVTVHKIQERRGDFFWCGNTVYPCFYSTEHTITKIGITEPQRSRSPSRRPFARFT